jgi:glycosyltransferase involved in cell wall biosynthesis
MRIVQLIDTLETGGAERMAVNYANALSEVMGYTALVATRRGGALANQINEKVKWTVLNKKSTFDLKAIYKFYKFCKSNQIDWIHAHSSSFFLAVIIKLFLPKIKILWHDHYGTKEELKNHQLFILKLCQSFLNLIVVVNQNLKTWNEQNLKHKKVYDLPNFSPVVIDLKKSTILNGEGSKRILCLANLRHQKNHDLLLKVAKEIQQLHDKWSFHLVGTDYQDDYSKHLKNQIEKLELTQQVFIYGAKEDTNAIISAVDICVLTSKIEGLPVSLIEYGKHKKAVVCTAVGEIPNILTGDNGLLVPANDVAAFTTALTKLIENPERRKKMGENLYETVQNQFSEEKVIAHYLKLLMAFDKPKT